MMVITKIFNIIRVIKTVIKHNLSSSFKRAILRGYLRYNVFNNFYSKNKVIPLLDLKIKYSVYGGFTYAFNDIFINNEYWFKAENNSPFIIDCGSNIGLSVLYFKQLYPNSTIIAFEPDIDAYDCLSFNVNQNNFLNVELHNKALSKIETILKLSYEKDRPGSIRSTTENSSLASYREVEAVKLSSYINGPVDFMKMDIEGAETPVFQELQDSNKLKYIKHIVLEYHHHMSDTTDCLSVILGILEANNFSYQLHTTNSTQSNVSEPQLIMIQAIQK